MPAETAPPEIQELATRRADARRARDWALADRLRGEIEAAGWKVVDASTLWSLERATAPTLEADGLVRYGSSDGVPSRLADAPVGTATVVILASGRPEDAVRAVEALAEHGPDGTQLVVVANGVRPADAPALVALDSADPGAPGIATEVVWTSVALGHAAALNAGIRRAAAPVVILLDTALEPGGDVVTPLVEALDDPSVAVAGTTGLVTTDLRRFATAPPDALDVDAVAVDAMAFRRADYVSAGPLDEHFGPTPYLAAWWSLVLRDAAVEGAPEDAPARRAVQVPGLPLARRGAGGLAAGDTGDPGGAAGDATSRRAKKDFYRFLKRFASRRDLLVGSGSGRS